MHAVNMFLSITLNVDITKLFCGLYSMLLYVANGGHIGVTTGGHIGVTTGGHIGDFKGVTKKKGKTLSFN